MEAQPKRCRRCLLQDMADEKKKENSEKSAETPEKTADAPENHPTDPHEA